MQDETTPTSPKYWALFYKIQGVMITVISPAGKAELGTVNNLAHKIAKAVHETI